MEFKNDIDNDCGFHVKMNGSFCAPDDIIVKLKESIIPNKNIESDKLLNILKKKYDCETEICILDQPEVKNIIGRENIVNIINQYFKPDGPRESNKWFSNTDIDSVLQQIKQKYIDKNFLHINFQMIDFEKNQSELSILDWPTKYKEGFRSFGTVMNTDISTGRGQHWLAIYGSFQDTDTKFSVEYFNSSGDLPMNEINTWLIKIKHLWQPFFNKPIIDIVVTRIVNQLDGWNCGSYSLYYIISRLNGVPYQYFKSNYIGDANMQEFRKFLFRKENN